MYDTLLKIKVNNLEKVFTLKVKEGNENKYLYVVASTEESTIAYNVDH
jgi:hypothetical protein